MRHLDLLEKFLDRVVAAKLRLKLPKSLHAVDELEALGMIYNGDTMRKTEWTYSVLTTRHRPGQSKCSGSSRWDSTTESTRRATLSWWRR